MDPGEAFEKVTLEHPASVFRADASVRRAVAGHLLGLEDVVRHGGKALVSEAVEEAATR
jgi:hypothetical protein